MDNVQQELWNLQDVDVTLPDILEDGKFLKYNATSDKMELDNVKQWINVPMTNLPYVMKNIAGNEVWQTLSSQTEITNIETDVANL